MRAEEAFEIGVQLELAVAYEESSGFVDKVTAEIRQEEADYMDDEAEDPT